MMILALELGKFNTTCCIYDSATRKHSFETIATKRTHLDHCIARCKASATRDQRGRANDLQADEKTDHPSSVASHGSVQLSGFLVSVCLVRLFNVLI